MKKEAPNVEQVPFSGKKCLDCKHSFTGSTGRLACKKSPASVDAAGTTSYEICSDIRQNSSSCGPSAAWYEERDDDSGFGLVIFFIALAAMVAIALISAFGH